MPKLSTRVTFSMKMLLLAALPGSSSLDVVFYILSLQLTLTSLYKKLAVSAKPCPHSVSIVGPNTPLQGDGCEWETTCSIAQTLILWLYFTHPHSAGGSLQMWKSLHHLTPC